MAKRPATTQERAELIEPLYTVCAALFAIAALGDDLAENGTRPEDAGDALARLAMQARANLVNVIDALDP